MLLLRDDNPAYYLSAILVWTAFITLPDGKLHVSILDVGQGESILIRTPEGKNILVDTGPEPNQPHRPG